MKYFYGGEIHDEKPGLDKNKRDGQIIEVLSTKEIKEIIKIVHKKGNDIIYSYKPLFDQREITHIIAEEDVGRAVEVIESMPQDEYYAFPVLLLAPVKERGNYRFNSSNGTIEFFSDDKEGYYDFRNYRKKKKLKIHFKFRPIPIFISEGCNGQMRFITDEKRGINARNN